MAKYNVFPVLVEISKEYIGKEDECIKRFGSTRLYLRLIGYGHKQPSAKAAVKIEQGTNGEITRKDLRPDDWAEIWPELK